MSKCRIMGACVAGSTNNMCNVNLNSGGGNKKQGLPFSINGALINHQHIKIHAYGTKRDVIFTINQLGGVGHTAIVDRGGVRPKPPYIYGH